MRFLIDECLATGLVEVANAAGHEAQHVVRIGKAGWKDYAVTPLHAGLDILLPNVNRLTQQRLFHGAIMKLRAAGDPINQVLEVDIDGDEAVFTLYDLPSFDVP